MSSLWKVFSHCEEYLRLTQVMGGSLPSELGTITNLRHLFLRENLLSGSIPSEFGRLSSLSTYTRDECSRSLVNTSFSDHSNHQSIFETVATSHEFSFLNKFLALAILELSLNQDMTGTVPEEICMLQSSGQLQFGMTGSSFKCECCQWHMIAARQGFPIFTLGIVSNHEKLFRQNSKQIRNYEACVSHAEVAGA